MGAEKLHRPHNALQKIYHPKAGLAKTSRRRMLQCACCTLSCRLCAACYPWFICAIRQTATASTLPASPPVLLAAATTLPAAPPTLPANAPTHPARLPGIQQHYPRFQQHHPHFQQVSPAYSSISHTPSSLINASSKATDASSSINHTPSRASGGLKQGSFCCRIDIFQNVLYSGTKSINCGWHRP